MLYADEQFLEPEFQEYMNFINNMDLAGSAVLTPQKVDDHFNEYQLTDDIIADMSKEELDEIYESSENYDWYLINDTCINVPIKIITNDNTYCSCILILKEKNNSSIIYNTSFNFIQSSNYKYNSFVIYPKLIEYFAKKPIGRYVNNEYTLYLCINNVWYEYDFTIKLGELDIHIGTLKYLLISIASSKDETAR